MSGVILVDVYFTPVSFLAGGAEAEGEGNAGGAGGGGAGGAGEKQKEEAAMKDPSSSGSNGIWI